MIKKIFLTAVFCCFSYSALCQTIRFTSFDDRPICEENKGVWREFGNGCADQCHAKFDEFTMCSQALTYACDCGKGRCWDGEMCVLMRDYKKIYDKEVKEEQKILDAAKDKRKEALKESEQKIMIQMLGTVVAGKIINVDPKAQSSSNVEKFYEKDLIEKSKQIVDDLKNPKDQTPAPAAASPQIQAAPNPAGTTQIEANPAGITHIDANPVANSQNTKKEDVKEFKVPPFFLQQEEAKEKEKQGQAAKDVKTNAEVDKTKINKAKPGISNLPEISLP